MSSIPARHSATGTATGVNGINLSSDLTINSTHTNAGVTNDSWSLNAGSNYNIASGTIADTVTPDIPHRLDE